MALNGQLKYYRRFDYRVLNFCALNSKVDSVVLKIYFNTTKVAFFCVA